MIAEHRFVGLYQVVAPLDVFQEPLLRACARCLDSAARSASGPGSFKIATNACLDALKRPPKRLLPRDYGPSLSR